MHSLQGQNVTVSYGTSTIIDQLNIDIPRGKDYDHYWSERVR